jgi:hypothetical protein
VSARAGWAAALAAGVGLAGCASAPPGDGQARPAAASIVDQFTTAVQTSLDKARNGGVVPYASIESTPELSRLMSRHPVTDAKNPPAWPRVAITVTSAPRYATQGGYFLFSSPRPDDCIAFNLKVWTDERTAKAYDRLQLCADYFNKTPRILHTAMLLWPRREAWPLWKNTGSVRTDGPQRPTTNAPIDPLSQRWFAGDAPFMSYLIGLLLQLGYNWDDLYDRRVWIVSVPA